MDFLKNINWTYVIVCVLAFIIFSFFCGNLLTEDQPSSTAESFNSIEFMDDESNETIKSDGDKGEVVLYFASWCGWSQKFLPEWEKFEKMAKEQLPGVRLTKMQCESDNEALCMQKSIEGYPTIVFYPKNKNQMMYDDDRNADKLLEFIKQNV